MRHLKCDEERPACLRCRSTGRTCDGYLGNTKRKAPVRTLPVPAQVTRPQKSLVRVQTRDSLLAGHLSPAISGTTQERQCFEYFRCQIGRELSAALELKPTYDFILQSCHSDEVVKASVIAIGSMGQRLRINHLLTSNNQQANALQEFAQVQYCKALRNLHARMTSDPERSVELAVISCFLFTVLEFLQGNDADALIHLRSGLNILRRQNEFQNTTDLLRKEITCIFSVLDRQATVWLGLEYFQAPVIAPADMITPHPSEFGSFGTLDEAACALNFQITRLHHFRQFVTAKFPLLRNIPMIAQNQRQEMLHELEQWPGGIERLLQEVGETNIDGNMRSRISVMKMNYAITLMLLTRCLDPPSKLNNYDGYESEFRGILSSAKILIGTMGDNVQNGIEGIVAANNQGINPVPLFSFYAGIIQPLYILAINCRNLDLCREAVTLLCRNPWREGAWDSFSMAKIANRKINHLDKGGYYDQSLVATDLQCILLSPDEQEDPSPRSLGSSASLDE